jgi:hypothetical protein
MKGKDYTNILYSYNIYELDSYLKTAHPDDPNRIVLKPRLIKLLREYLQNAQNGDPKIRKYQQIMVSLKRGASSVLTFQELGAIYKQREIRRYKEEMVKRKLRQIKQEPYNFKTGTVNKNLSASNNNISTENVNSANTSEEEEFKMLMAESDQEHKFKTVKILNSLFDNDPTSKECAIMIQNKSDCNIIMRIDGIGNAKYRLAIPAKQNNSIVVEKGDYVFSSLVCGAQYSSQKTIQKSMMVSLGK